MNKGLQNRYVVLLLLVCIYATAVFCRLEWGMRYRGEMFSSESALRLYYAGLVARGEAIPAVDYKAQYPEGLHVVSRNPVLMEYLTGSIYSVLGLKMPFVSFIRICIPLIASFSIFAVYLTVRETTGDTVAALVSTLFYAVTLPAITRASGWEFLQETVALPAIFFQVYFFLTGVRRGGWWRGICSGAFLALALASWKISQLYFLIFACFAGGAFLIGKPRPDFIRTYLTTAFFAALAGAAVPFLREGYFLVSIPMSISYALAFSFLFRRYELRFRLRERFVFVAVLLLFLLVFPQSPRLTHVYDLLLYKVLLLGKKPANPLSLPFEVRALWIDPFLSPSLFELIYFFFPLLLPGAVGAGIVLTRIVLRRADTAMIFILCNAGSFCAAYLLIRRLRVFFIYFLVLLIGYLIAAVMRRPKRIRGMGMALLLVCLCLEAGKPSGLSASLVFRPAFATLGISERSRFFQTASLSRSDRDLIEWLKENTGPDDVILAHYHISPMIRVYADRPVNLTSLFESKPLREKVRRFTEALFEGEESLYRLAVDFGADYLVYSIDTILDDSPNSWRYLTDHLRLNRDMAAYRMHFLPATLRRFSLVYENEFFRVYRVLPENSAIPAAKEQPGHPLYYRYDLFKRFSGSTARFREYIENVYRVYLAGSQALIAGRFTEARRDYETALLLAPDFPEPYAGLGAIAEQEGRGDDALNCYREYLRLKPEGKFAGELRRRIISASQK